MATLPSSSSPPELFTDDELAAAGSLLSLYGHRPVGFFPRWLKKRKRSVPSNGEDEEQVKGARLSPATPLSFDPSGGDETPPPPTPIPPPSLPPPAPLLPRPKMKAPKNNRGKERCRKLATEYEHIAALSARKLNLEQSVVEAKNRCQLLKAENSCLKQLRFQQQLREMSSGTRTLDLFPVGPSSAVARHHEQQPLHSVQMPYLNWRPAAAAAGGAEWLQQQRAVEYARARKRRLELQRTKSCPSSSLPSPSMQSSR